MQNGSALTYWHTDTATKFRVDNSSTLSSIKGNNSFQVAGSAWFGKGLYAIAGGTNAITAVGKISSDTDIAISTGGGAYYHNGQKGYTGSFGCTDTTTGTTVTVTVRGGIITSVV